jgi:histidine triad (HIT) family protein
MATIFEKIIAGEIEADMVYRDDEIVAFRDIRPASPVHLLIVPVRPIPTIDDLAGDDLPLVGRMVGVARDLARAEGISEEGYRLVMNCGRNGGQEVFHLHLHLMGGRPLGPMAGPA